jgi:hypothetical protein
MNAVIGFMLHGWRPLRIIALSFAILVAAEVMGHMFSHRLGPGRTMPDSEIDTKRILAWQLAESGVPVRVLVLGNSTANAGVVPEIIKHQLDGNANTFNGALSGYDYSIHQAITERIYLPLLRPQVVILCVTIMDFNLNEKGFSDNSRSLEDSTAWSLLMGAPSPTLNGLLYEYSALFRYSFSFQHWLRCSLSPSKRSEADNRWGAVPFDGSANPLAQIRGEVVNHLKDFEIGGQSREEMFALAKALRSRGLKPLIVNMPLSPKLWRLYPPIEADYKKYLEALNNQCRTFGFPLLDLHRILNLDEEAFVDEYHANELGRLEISRAIAKKLLIMIATTRNPLPSSDNDRIFRADVPGF